jgi:hypothetical protein
MSAAPAMRPGSALKLAMRHFTNGENMRFSRAKFVTKLVAECVTKSVTLVSLSALLGVAAISQGQAANPPARTSNSDAAEKSAGAAAPAISSLPDWSGLWTINMSGLGPSAPKAEPPVLTPPYAAELKTLREAEARNDEPATESANCLPPGMPTIMFQPYDIEFLFTPGRVTIIQEAYMQVRRVFTDGRGHPADLDPTFNGHSIGHWEGDTLVIDTAGLGHKTPLGFDRLEHGPKLHVVERIRLTGPDTLEDRMTLTDPDVLLQPWHEVRTFTRHRELDMMEFICEENNRNPIDQTGHVSTILRK